MIRDILYKVEVCEALENTNGLVMRPERIMKSVEEKERIKIT